MAAFLRSVLSLLEVIVIVGLLAVPFWLVVRFPEAANNVASLYATLVPWFLGMVVLLVFRPQLERFFEGVSKAFGRIRSIGSANTRAEFQQEAQLIAAESRGDEVEFWHVRYVAATIYGSQVSALFDLNDGPALNRESLGQYYSDYLQQGGDKVVTFDSWLRYMTDYTGVVKLNAQGLYEITPVGRKFVKDAREINWGPRTFRF